MTTSGTTNFNLDVGDIVDLSFRMAGLEVKTGADYTDARRALDLMLAEWGNRGLNFWTIAQTTIPVVANTLTYSLPADCIDVIEHVIRQDTGAQGQLDRPMVRISMSTYAKMANKLARQLPTQAMVDRQVAPTITLYPCPDQNYSMIIWYLRRIQDAGANGTLNADAPVRFLPALMAGMAFRVAQFRPDVGIDKLGWLEAQYEKQYSLAAGEDRDRSSFFVRPSRTMY